MSAPAILLIGGLDSSGGAGVIRDARAVRRAGGIARIALTASTAQTDHAVRDVHLLPLASLRAQIRSAFEQGPIAAVNIGMLGDAARVAALVDVLPPELPWVLDPVLVSSSGAALLDADGRRQLRQLLLPKLAVLTPNLPELQALAADLGLAGATQTEQLQALLQFCPALLLKGGHAAANQPESVDWLYCQDQPPQAFAGPRHPFSLRGTGCELASSIAVALAMGRSLAQAVAMARQTLADRFAWHAARIASLSLAG